MNQLSQIQEYINDYESQSITVVEGYDHSQYQVLRKIDLYMNSQFVTGQQDEDGFKKFFHNIVTNRKKTATKAVDIDRKDIRVISEYKETLYVTWLFEQELRDFMKENDFGELINQICDKLPRYGTVVVKNVNGVPTMSWLKNLVWDTTVDIEQSSFVLERHAYSPDEFKKEAADKEWKDSDKIIELYKTKKKKNIQVIEAYTYVQRKEIEGGEKTDLVFSRSIWAGVEFAADKAKKDKESTGSICLQDPVEIKENPYRSVDWEEEEGRGLGIGVVEELFGNQEQVNELYILERKMYYWSSKKLFQTRDQTVPANLMSGAKNGQVFQTKDEINQIDMTSKSFPEFANLVDRIERNADQKTFNYEVATGESMSSGTPFRLGALLANAVNSYYEGKKERIGLFVVKLIEDFVIPEFQKRKKDKHTIPFDGTTKQVEKLRELSKNYMVDKEVRKIKSKTGKYPSLQALDAIVKRVEKKLNDKPYYELPEGIYDGLKYKLTIEITGESKNIQSELETLGNVFQVYASNPGIMQDPTARAIFEEILNLAGRNPIDVLGVAGPSAPAAVPALGGATGPVPAPGAALPV